MPNNPNITLLTAFPTGPITPKLHKKSRTHSANTPIRTISFAIARSSCFLPFVRFLLPPDLPEPLLVLEEDVLFFPVPDLLPEVDAILISIPGRQRRNGENRGSDFPSAVMAVCDAPAKQPWKQ